MALTSIRIQSPAHVRAWYHVLAHFDLGDDPMNCVNASWIKRALPYRRGAEPLGRAFGRFHAAYRKTPGRHALAPLATALPDESVYDAALDSLAANGPPPAGVTPLVRRLLARLADDAGARLVGLMRDLVRAERDAFIDTWFRSLAAPGAGLDSFLRQRLAPLVPVLYAEADQTLIVLPVEALDRRAYHVTPARGVHHVALPATLHDAFFHALYGMVRHRTDRLIRPYVPASVKADPSHPMNVQVRVDCGLTTTFHLLLRKMPEEAEPFRTWARDQFAFGLRQPEAAVEALHPMNLLPEEAIPAVRTLLGDQLTPL